MLRLGILFAFLSFMLACKKNNIGYVDIEVISEKYEGVIQVNKEIQTVMDRYTKERDSIYQVFQKEVLEYQNKYGVQNASSKSKTAYDQLADKSKKIEQYLQSKEQMLSQQNNKKLDSVAKVIKDFIIDYAKEKRYTFILGKNQTANLLYGDPSKEVTVNILKVLNEKFESLSDSLPTSSK